MYGVLILKLHGGRMKCKHFNLMFLFCLFFLMSRLASPLLSHLAKCNVKIWSKLFLSVKKEKKKKTVERKRSTATTDRPSVRKELKDIKQQQNLKSSAPKYPVKKKSKKKVR